MKFRVRFRKVFVKVGFLEVEAKSKKEAEQKGLNLAGQGCPNVYWVPDMYHSTFEPENVKMVNPKEPPLRSYKKKFRK